MIENVIARRYARGLAQVAVERNELVEVRDELFLLADLVTPGSGEISVPEFGDFLGSPTVTTAEKIRVTDVLCESLQLGKTVSDFLNVLIIRHRVTFICLIAEEYQLISAKMEGIQGATVETAQPLQPEQEAKLKKQLEASLGSTVQVTVIVNPDLLAGVKVKVNDTVLDGSLRGRLTRLSAELH